MNIALIILLAVSVVAMILAVIWGIHNSDD